MLKIVYNIKNKIKKYKILVANFSYLSALQIFNLLLPLVTYPYLIRVLGGETYGLIIFAQTVINYLIIIVNFGFNFHATNEVSINRENNHKLSEIVNSVLFIKIILFFFTFLLLIIIISSIRPLREHYILYLFSMIACLGEALFPIWYFQGIERMKYITYINLITRTIFSMLIFFLIRHKADYILLPILNGTGLVLGSIIALYIVFIQDKIKLQFPSFLSIKYNFKESLPIFISNLSVKVYSQANKLIVGSLLGYTEVAYYDLGDKLLRILKIPINILSQTIFPKMSNNYDKKFLQKLIFPIFSFSLFVFFVIQVFAEPIVTLIGGTNMLPSADIVRILTISILPLIISNFLGVQTLLALGFKKQFSKVIVLSGLIYLISLLIIYFLKYINIYSISFLQVLVEFYMLFHFFKICKKNNLI